MEVNNISSQNLNNLNNVSGQSLEKIASGSSLTKASDDASSLFISEALSVQRNELAQSLQNLNDGIAMTRIAEDSLLEQKSILEQIRVKTLEAMNATTSQEGKDAIQNDIQKMIEQYNNISEQTTYNGLPLLQPNANGETSIHITTSSDSFSLEIGDTSTISQTLQNYLNSFTYEDMQNMLGTIDQGINTINEFINEFASASSQMESSARNTLTEQVNLARANSSLTDIDFGAEVTDFNKTNLIAQLGFLAASQANAMQEQNVRLLT